MMVIMGHHFIIDGDLAGGAEEKFHIVGDELRREIEFLELHGDFLFRCIDKLYGIQYPPMSRADSR